MSREDQYNVTVSVTIAGTTRDLGTFDGFSGGEIDSEEAKFWPGALGDQIALGGRRSVSNFTVRRLYDLARDHGLMGWLIGGVGKAKVVAHKQPLDVDKNPYGKPLVYTGTLKQLSPPDHDSGSNDAAQYSLEVSSASVVQTQ